MELQEGSLSLSDLNDNPQFLNCPAFFGEFQRRPEYLRKWFEVDLVKILVSSLTLGNCDLTVFADMDVADIRLNNSGTQRPMVKHGLVPGIGNFLARNPFENILWYIKTVINQCTRRNRL